MIRFRVLPAFLILIVPFSACAVAEDVDDDLAEIDSYATTVVSDDDLNGLWNATIDGVIADDVVIESWPAVGVRVHVGDQIFQLTRGGDQLSSSAGSLLVDGHGSGVRDDTMQGTLDGKAIGLARDTEVRNEDITLAFPGDRPFRAFLDDLIIPAAQRDRESYKYYSKYEVGNFIRSCVLYKTGSWPRTYMKGATLSEQYTNFNKIITAVNYLRTTPRRLTKEYKFYNTVTQNLKDPSQAGLALSTLSMYFSTGAGSSLRLPITDDSIGYFITDKPSRAARIGLVAMDTPTHDPLASTFGRQLLDLGEMPAADTVTYARALMELLAKSSNASAPELSGVGRSALTDWYAVMAIEDYRGMVFGFPTLGWGYNMTSVQFFGLISRALARPGQLDSAGNAIKGQVVVGSELRPGEASYADVLNHGNDMQEYADMARLKTLASNYLKARHPALVTAVTDAFVGIVPDAALDFRARSDIFHYVAAQLYDAQGRSKNLRGEQADRAIAATTALVSTLVDESVEFEAYILQQGITKNNVAAPKSTGF